MAKIRQLEIDPCCGITDKTDKPESLPQTWDAESLWDASLLVGLNEYPEEEDIYETMMRG